MKAADLAIAQRSSQGRIDDDPVAMAFALDAADIGLFEYDCASRRYRFSERARLIWGLAPTTAELTPESLIAMVHAEDRHLSGIVAASLDPAGSGEYMVEHRVIGEDGVERIVQSRGRTAFEGHGSGRRAVRSFGAIRDVGQQHREEAARHDQSLREQYLLRLGDALRPLRDATVVQGEACRLLGEQLGAGRVLYGERAGDDDAMFQVRQEYRRDFLPASVGVHYLKQSGCNAVDALREGKMLVFEDIAMDPRLSPEERAGFLARGTAAAAIVAFVLEGRIAAFLSVHFPQPHAFTPLELSLLDGTAQRTWDAVERARAEHALADSERRFRQMADAIPQLMWVTDTKGHFEFLNNQWSTYTGLSLRSGDAAELISLTLHADDRPRVLAHLQEALASGEQAVIEFRLRSAQGEYRWFLMRAEPDIDPATGQVQRWYAAAADIHDRRLAEEALLAADRRKDEFLATLAHELRNPLAPLRNGLQIVRLTAQGERLHQALDIMDRQLTHLVRLVDDLLDVGRITAGKLELQRRPVGLGDIVTVSLEEVRAAMEGRGHGLALDVPHEPLWVLGDPDRLSQITANLLTNAVRYTPPGGHIALSLRREDDTAVLQVSDNGIGIPAEELSRVFDLFSQVRGSQAQAPGGLGIGLSLVRRLVLLHGGQVSVHSDGPGLGSAFTVRLPLLAGRDEVPVVAIDPVQVVPRDVLVVDDNLEAASTLANLLELSGHDVRVANDGPAALAEAARRLPKLVLLDLGMPGMDGHEVARRLRHLPGGDELRIAALTGWGQAADRQRTREAGFDHHLVKPVSPATLDGLLASL